MRLSNDEFVDALNGFDFSIRASGQVVTRKKPESSPLKIKGTEITQAIQDLQPQLAASYGGPLPDDSSAQQLGHDFAF